MELQHIDDYSIDFHFEDIDPFPFPESAIRKWILYLIENESKLPGTLTYIFCSDDFLLKMNEEYLKHDTYTDIITFDYSEEFSNISGDIFISIPRVEENAMNFDVSMMYELCRVIAHGVLHICGYPDKLPAQQAVMKSKEDYYLGLVDFL